MSYHRDTIIRIQLERPWPGHEPKVLSFTLGESEFREALTPLPRNREFIPEEFRRGEEQESARRQLIRMVTPHIAAALARLLAENDTDHGYPREDAPRVRRSLP